MNIFWLAHGIDESVKALCDKHVVKMVLETAQLLCSAYKDTGLDPPYRVTHYNHPCAVWVRASSKNYEKLCVYGQTIAAEYTHRYTRRHKSLDVIHWCVANKDALTHPHTKPTTPPQCMPEKYKHPDLVTAYRAYYKHKATVIKMTWTKRPKPKWLNL